MEYTSVEVSIDLLNDNLRLYTSPSVSDNQSFCDISNLSLSIKQNYTDFLTLEHNINILDGSISPLNKNNNYSYISTKLSDDKCNCDSEIQINILNTSPEEYINIAGLKLYFGSSKFISDASIIYLKNNLVLKSQSFSPTHDDYECWLGGKYFNKIILKINKTKFPNMFPRIQYIDYGFLHEFKEDEILSCKIIEEVDPVSSKVPINTCDIELYSKDNLFNFLNDTGVYDILQENDKFEIYGIINNNRFKMGEYYLDTWEGNHDYVGKFHLISILGVLDKIPYDKPRYKKYGTVQETIDYVLDGLLDKSGYNISPSLANIKIDVANITPASIKQTLQLIAFSINACIDDTRDGILKIYSQSKAEQFILNSSDVFSPVNLTKNEAITGLDITIFSYDIPNITYGQNNEPQGDVTEIFNGILNAGEIKTFNLTQPLYSVYYSYSNGNTVNNWRSYGNSQEIDGSYKLEFKAGNAGNYKIKVAYYKENSSTYSAKLNDDRYSKLKQNILKVENNKMLCVIMPDNLYPTLLYSFSNNLLSFYNNSEIKIEFSCFFNPNVKSGAYGGIFTEYNIYCMGTIIKQEIDLSGGFISKCTAIAINKSLSSYYFMTPKGINSELYCNNDILL